MFPIEIPKGTTPESLLLEVLPATHARFVPEGTDGTEHVIGVRVDGGASYSIRVRGRELSVAEGEAEGAALALRVERKTVERFLDDWMGEQRFVPKFLPPSGVVLMTDPRILKRLMMVNGSVEMGVPDFEGGPIGMSFAAGTSAKRGASGEPDVVVETSLATFERVLAGALAPEDAIAEGRVVMKGKTLVAMQFAFALAPFFPKR
jgi:hypothetical protein